MTHISTVGFTARFRLWLLALASMLFAFRKTQTKPVRTEAAFPTVLRYRRKSCAGLRYLSPNGSKRTVLAFVCAMTFGAQAQNLEGTKTITLHTVDEQKLTIGTVTFSKPIDGKYTFTLAMKVDAFTDHFLSMREFKCVGGSRELMCFVPYPYARGQTVTERDFAWLEHALLFMFKQPTDFGAKLWNGVYFQLKRTDTGLRGTPQAVDLNFISAPPADLTVPPFKPSLRDDYTAKSRWVEFVSIE
jgi:hypothetical protein